MGNYDGMEDKRWTVFTASNVSLELVWARALIGANGSDRGGLDNATAICKRRGSTTFVTSVLIRSSVFCIRPIENQISYNTLAQPAFRAAVASFYWKMLL